MVQLRRMNEEGFKSQKALIFFPLQLSITFQLADVAHFQSFNLNGEWPEKTPFVCRLRNGGILSLSWIQEKDWLMIQDKKVVCVRFCQFGRWLKYYKNEIEFWFYFKTILWLNIKNLILCLWASCFIFNFQFLITKLFLIFVTKRSIFQNLTIGCILKIYK